jgi:hypothetical protein
MDQSHTSTTVRKRRGHGIAALILVSAVLATASCSGSIAHSYRSFQSALDRGANCSELFDQRARFHNEDTLAKIDRDLARIGCTSPDATRTDR